MKRKQQSSGAARVGRCGRWGGFFAALLLMALAAGAGRAEEQWELSFDVRGMELESQGYTPIYLDIKNPRKQRVEVELIGSNYSGSKFNFTRQINLGESVDLRLELPVPSIAAYNIKLHQQHGRTLDNYFHPKSSSRYGGPGSQQSLYVINNFQLRELSEHLSKNRRGSQPTEAITIQAESLPVLWQSYAGLRGVMLLGTGDLGKLSDRQREALAQWVRWGSGRLWLIGKDARETAAALNLPLGQARSRPASGIERHDVLTGQVWLKEDADFSRWRDTDIAPLRGIVSELSAGNLATFSSGNGLLEDLGLISAWAITGILLLLGVTLGPVNYWYIHRKRSLLLFFLTTPLLALVGSLAVFGYSALSEGWSAKYKEAALLIGESGSEAGAVYHALGIYSGLTGRILQYPDNALLFPFRKGGESEQTFSADLTSGIRLTGGWVSPRTPSGILSVTPVTARMGIEISRENGRYFALNTLTHTVRRLAVTLEDGGSAVAANIAPGERRELQRAKDGKERDELRGRINGYFHSLAFADLRILAECEGLPYLTDNGLGGDRLSGAYFYAASGRGLPAEQGEGQK